MRWASCRFLDLPLRDPAGADEMDEVDELVAEALEGWQPDMSPILAAIRAAADEATSHEEFQAALDRISPDLPVARLARRLAKLGMIGRGLGDAGVE